MEVKNILLSLCIDNEECNEELLIECLNDVIELAIDESDLPVVDFTISEYG